MSRPIQAWGTGFLGMLGMKNEGQLPAELTDALQPIVDLFPFYMLGTRETFPVTAGQGIRPVSNYVFPELNVPANEVWWVHGYSVQVTVPAAHTWNGVPVHYTRNTLPIHVGSGTSLGNGATATVAQTASIGGFLAAPGDTFGVLTQDSTGAGVINGFGELTITRFPA